MAALASLLALMDKYSSDYGLPKRTALSQRPSPLGDPEYIVPDSKWSSELEGANAVTNPDSQRVYYKESVANDPLVQAHERIHVGQNKLPADVSPQELAQMFPEYPKLLGMGNNKAHEVPAYLFSENPKKPQAVRYQRMEDFPAVQMEALRKYLDLLKFRNNDITPLEARMPQDLLKSYMTQYGTTLAPPKIIK